MTRLNAFIGSLLLLAASHTFAGTVDSAQRMLNQLGYNAGAVDGAYGKKTRGALEAFYADNGSSFDGKLDANEIADLQAAMSERGIQPYVPLSSFEVDRQAAANPESMDRLVTESRHSRYVGQGVFWYGPQTSFADFNGDGIDDIVTVGVSAKAQQDRFKPGGKCVDYSSTGSTNWLISKPGCGVDSLKMKPKIAYGKPGGGYTDSSDKMFIHTSDERVRQKAQGFEHAMDVFTVDFNNDGIPDLFIPDSGFGWNGVASALYLSNGDGTWTYSTFSHVKGIQSDFAHGGTVGDIDADGDIDIVTTKKGKNLACWFNNGDGTFKYKSVCIRTPDPIITISLSDTDGDGDLDLYTGGSSYEGKGGWAQYGGGYRVYENLGNMRFREQVKLPQVDCWVNNPKSETFDFDEDGDQDFVAVMVGETYAFTAINLIENLGNGRWKQNTIRLTDWDDVDPAHFIRRTYKVGHGNDKCGLYSLQHGKWKKHIYEGHKLTSWVTQLSLADVDRDGDKDIIMIQPQAQHGWDEAIDIIQGGWLDNFGDGRWFVRKYTHPKGRGGVKRIRY